MLDGGLDPETGQGIASAHWHQGAAAIERAGRRRDRASTQIAGLEVAVYAGRVVDASGAALQNDGSIVMGIGSALFEATEYADGQMLTTTFSEYQVPAFSDVPAVHAPRSSRAARAPTCTASARPRCRWSPRRSATRCARSALAQARMPVRPEAILDAARGEGRA